MNLLDILYPPTCLHCEALLDSQKSFCEDCLEYFSLISTQGRCVKCFGEISALTGVCLSCRKIAHPLRKLACCFDHLGPAASLLRAFQKHPLHLAKDIAAYMVVQLDRLQWPLPHCIVPVPHLFQKNSAYIARALSQLTSCPAQLALKRKWDPNPTFSLKKRCNISQQFVLLVDDQMKSRTTIRAAAWALEEQWPNAIYGLTFCFE